MIKDPGIERKGTNPVRQIAITRVDPQDTPNHRIIIFLCMIRTVGPNDLNPSISRVHRRAGESNLSENGSQGTIGSG